jgi:hypothetical protein
MCAFDMFIPTVINSGKYTKGRNKGTTDLLEDKIDNLDIF